MEWVLYIFKRGKNHYLIPAWSEDDAWTILCQKQTCRLEIGKRDYKLVKTMNGSETLVKL